MRACTTISESRSLKQTVLSLLLACALWSGNVYAQNPPTESGGNTEQSAPKETPSLFEQDSPYLEYGDFNMNEEETEDTLYLQYGRYFGFSLGLGYQSATGNRGKLYQSALPRFDARMQYWFNFHFAAELGIFFANHEFFDGTQNNQVRLIGYGFGLKYYFDTINASAPVSFANPFLVGGVGAISKSETNIMNPGPLSDSTFSARVGGGLEFPISHKKTYLSLEALYHTQNFGDSADSYEKINVPDLTGGFFTLMLHLMFVW